MKDRWWELKETKDKVTFSKCSVRIFDQSNGGGGGQAETRFQLHKVKACNNYASRRHLRFVFFLFQQFNSAGQQVAQGSKSHQSLVCFAVLFDTDTHKNTKMIKQSEGLIIPLSNLQKNPCLLI